MKSEKGFSLVELLVVVIIIAIVAAIAIPNLLASRRAANEASAISSLRTIHSAESTFLATLGNNTDYGDLAALSAVAAPNTAGLIDTALGSGQKSGYNFDITVDPAVDQVYCATADPISPGTTGSRSFGVSQAGVIYSTTATATPPSVACDAAGVITGATPIQ